MLPLPQRPMMYQNHGQGGRCCVSASRQRWFRLAYSAVIFIAIGFIYGWSLFSTPFSQEFGWDAATLSLTFSILMCSFCIGGIIGARLMTRLTPRIAQMISAALICAGFLGALLVSADKPWILYGTYGVLGGMGVGMSYTIVMGSTVPWFSDRTGLASGIMLMCYSCSTMILGSLASFMFSAVGWRETFVCFAAVIFVILAIGAFVIRRPTGAEINEIATQSAPLATSNNIGASKTSARHLSGKPRKFRAGFVHDYTTKQMLHHPAFYVYGLWMLCLGSCELGITGHANQIALSTGVGILAAIMFVSLLSVSNGVGRLIVGTIFDLINPVITMILIASFHCLGILILAMALITGSDVLLLIGIVCFGIGMSGVPVMGSGFAAKYFGPTHYANNLAILNLVIIPSALLGPQITSLFLMSTGGYLGALLVFFCISLIAIVFVLILRRIR